MEILVFFLCTNEKNHGLSKFDHVFLFTESIHLFKENLSFVLYHAFIREKIILKRRQQYAFY
jgi:hypothetical protein